MNKEILALAWDESKFDNNVLTIKNFSKQIEKIKEEVAEKQLQLNEMLNELLEKVVIVGKSKFIFNDIFIEYKEFYIVLGLYKNTIYTSIKTKNDLIGSGTAKGKRFDSEPDRFNSYGYEVAKIPIWSSRLEFFEMIQNNEFRREIERLIWNKKLEIDNILVYEYK